MKQDLFEAEVTNNEFSADEYAKSSWKDGLLQCVQTENLVKIFSCHGQPALLIEVCPLYNDKTKYGREECPHVTVVLLKEIQA